MSDAALRIGQNFPDTYSSRSDIRGGSAVDMSFEEVLNRQQLTSATLNALQPPTQSTSTANRPVSSSFTTLPVRPSVQVDDSPRLIEKPLPPELDSQTQVLLSHAPAAIPEGDALAETMLRNFHEYQQQSSASYEAIPVSGGWERAMNNESHLERSNERAEKVASPSSGIFSQILSRNDDRSAEPPLQSSRSSQEMETDASRFETAPEPQRQVIWSASWDNDQAAKAVEALFEEDGRLREEGWAALVSDPKQSHEEKAVIDDVAKQTRAVDERQGITDAFGSFFNNLLSGLTLGFYRPDGEPAPTGVMRVIDPFKKLAYDAPIKSLAIGVPVGAYHSAGNLTRNTDESREAPQEAKRISRGGKSSKPWLYRGARS